MYGNRRRMRGRRGRRLMRQRGERIERSFAHLYDTGGMRRTHLRGHTNILKRLLIHAGGFNLGLVMRHLIGIGTPRGLQGRVAAVLATLGVLMGVVRRRLTTISSSHRLIPAVRGRTRHRTDGLSWPPASTHAKPADSTRGLAKRGPRSASFSRERASAPRRPPRRGRPLHSSRTTGDTRFVSQMSPGARSGSTQPIER